MGRVLIIEDHAPLAKVIGIALARDGHLVRRVGRVDRAWDLEDVFDCAVSEIELPDGSGIELVAALLDAQRIHAAVFHADCRDAGLHEAARRLGPVVDKLGDLDELRAIVNAEIERTGELLEGVSRPARAAAVNGTSTGGRESGRSGTRRRLR